MSASDRPGRFITLEGGEGTGKSTQARLLAERLRARGIACLTTREPGGSPRAEALRNLILSGAGKPFGPLAEALLFSAARIDHLRQTIRPALAAGNWVICDRFADSTRVYQGALGDLDPGLVATLERVTLDGLKPDLTLVLDLPVEVGLARAAARRGGGGADRFEAESVAFHEKLRRAYLALVEAEPSRCLRIDAEGTAEAVAARIGLAVEAVLLTGADA